MIKNYKKSKKERVFEILDKSGYILDQQAFEIFGEDGWTVVTEYERMWKKLNADRDFFKDKKIVEKKKGHRCHLVRLEGMDMWYKVGKEYFNEIFL